MAHQTMLAQNSMKALPIHARAPWLAPLAGFSDLPFRLLCREMGAAVACTEMVSAKGLVYGLRQKKGCSGTEDLLVTTPGDRPLVVQLFGAEAPFLAEAIAILRERGFTHFDLNMGCSVPKVTKTGAGSAMLRDIPNALNSARAMIEAAGQGNVGFKMRLGWDAGAEVYEHLACQLEAMGAGWLCLHPRFARQGFSGEADWRALARLRQKVALPLIASGDLFSAKDGVRCVQETGVDSVMFARGAIQSPAVFSFYLRMMDGETALPEQLPGPELLRLIRRHAALAKELTPGKTGRSGLPPALLKMRTVVPRYVKHLPRIKELRLALARCTGWEDLDRTLEGFFRPGQGGVGSVE